MIIKKLAVPLINDKILQQAEHCYIATSAITDEGFEFIRSRIPTKTKIDIVTSLDEPTSPAFLERLLSNYQGRINLNIYTRNVLHANLYVFDLPFRKSVAFVGSGTLSLEGLKDHEELFWRTNDPKEIESLMSWYTSYFQFSVPLSEQIVNEYRVLYPAIKQREIDSSKEKDSAIALTASSFSWASIKFRNQFFKMEDYVVLSSGNMRRDDAALRISRAALAEKVTQLVSLIQIGIEKMKLVLTQHPSIEPAGYPDRKIDRMYVAFGKDTDHKLITFEIGIGQMDTFIQARISNAPHVSKQRLLFHDRFEDAAYGSDWFRKVVKYLPGYTVEVVGMKKSIESLSQEPTFYAFLKKDSRAEFEIFFEKRFAPGDGAVNSENIANTFITEMTNLLQVFG